MQISVAAAAGLLGVDRATVWRYINLETDPLPAKKIGHGYVLWQSDVLAFQPRANRRRGPKPRSKQPPATPPE